MGLIDPLIRRSMEVILGLKAVSLFSGCGGFCEGMELAGFDIKVAVEWDRFSCETYRYNFPRTPLFEGDIHDFLAAKSAGHREKYKLDNIDLVFGGPPCQGFSQIGPRDLFDDRNELYQQYARIVSELRPRAFVMENVPNILLMKKGYFRDAIIKHFSRMGYKNTTYLKVSAVDFGVPQTRERVFFFGTRDDEDLPFDLKALAAFILDHEKAERPVTVAEAIGDLPKIVVPSGQTMVYGKASKPSPFLKEMRLDEKGPIYSLSTKRQRGVGPKDTVYLHNHHTKEIQDKRKRLIALLAPGAKADSLPKDIWNGARPEKWRRLHPDLPSYTILAQMHRDLSEWVHPTEERWITVREAARLQSFHDGFVFRSSEWQMLKQIGNAVPPLLGRAAGIMIHAILDVCDGKNLQSATALSQLPTVTRASPTRTVRRQKKAMEMA